MKARDIFWAVADTPDFVTQVPRLLTSPIFWQNGYERGKGKIIFTMPGLGAGDFEFIILKKWLQHQGAQVYDSGIKLNIVCPYKTICKLTKRIRLIKQESGQKIILIGHSLGGIFSRILSVIEPKSIDLAIAIGSPLHNPEQNTNEMIKQMFVMMRRVERALNQCKADIEGLTCECGIKESLQKKPRVPFFSILSQKDPIAFPNGSKDPYAKILTIPDGGHSGLVNNPEVYRHLNNILFT